MNTFYQVDRAKNKLKNKYDSGQTFIKKPNLKTFLDDVGNCTKIPREYFERIFSRKTKRNLNAFTLSQIYLKKAEYIRELIATFEKITTMINLDLLNSLQSFKKYLRQSLVFK